MGDEEIRKALEERASKDADGRDPLDAGLLAEVEQGASLGADIERRYLGMGVQMLSDDIPQRLDQRAQARLEKMLGRDLSQVRVHTGERAQRAAGAMGAQAFALGEKDVFFGAGGYNPASREGIGLLAHEVAHTVEAGTPGGTQVGFKAESSSGGRGEEFAESAEGRVLAQEDNPESGPAQGGEGGASGKGSKKSEPAWANKDAVARQAWQIIQDIARRDRDRHGSF